MVNLFPTGYESEAVNPEEIQSTQPIGYRDGVAFGFESGDFLLDGKNKMLDCNGVESWELWCTACVLTERYKHLAYSTDFGLELDPVFKAKSRDEAESILARQITEALLADPYQRTEYVESIEFEWDGAGSVHTTITIQGRNGASIDVVAHITKGAT